MSQLLTDFSERRMQVLHYLEAIARAERGARRGEHKAQAVARLNVLRAGTFLILYNLIEASVRSLVESIHYEIVSKSVPFQTLKQSIRRDVVRNFKSRSDPDAQKDMTDVPVQLVAVALDLDSGYPFSGNVDARKIRDVAEIYGFDIVADPAFRDGADLVTIKRARNDLAHGVKTYDEVGRDYTLGDLKDLSSRSLGYVEAVLRAVDRFLINEDFREVATPVA